MNEQLSGLDFETELLKISGKHSSHVLNIAEPLRDESDLKGSIKSESSTNVPYATVLAMSVKKESDVKKKDLQTMYYEFSPELSEMSSYYEVMGASYSSSAGKQKTNDLGLDYESPWVGTRKAEPWWRTADGNELASLVVQKSLDHVDNCDLPPPQNTSLGWNPFGYFSSNRIVTSSLTKKRAGDGLADLPIQVQKNLGQATPNSAKRASVED